MNKNGLIAAVAEKCGIAKKEAAEVVEATLDIITDSLKKGEKVQIVGFGCFEVRERAEREGRNPQNPETTIKIPACKVPVFKAGKVLKDSVKKSIINV